jgi:hypothetical protein
MAANNSFEKDMKTLYNRMMALSSSVCVEELENLRKKMEKMDYKKSESLYEYSGRMAGLEPAVFSCSPEAGASLEGARLALASLAYVKEKTNFMKAFDVFGVVRYMESVNDKSAETYVKTLVDSAIKELKKAKP